MLRRIPLHHSDEAITAIREDGAVILTDFASPEQVDQVDQDTRNVMAARMQDEGWQARYNRRIHAGLLYGRSATAREQWVLNRHLLSIVNYFLRTTNGESVDRVSAAGRSTDAMLSQAASITILEGGPAQPLHRDDAIWQKDHASQEATGYRLGSDLGIGMLLAAVDTTKANGATLVVPGSHLWADDRVAQEHEVVAAELQRGEALLFLTSTVHAGGANTTPNPRTMYAIFYCRSWVRPEANDFACYTREEVESWSPEAQKLAGYATDRMLGICDDGDALEALRRGSTQGWQDWEL